MANYLLQQNHQPVCTICNERVGMNINCCSKCHCKIHYKCLPADVFDITPGSVDIETNVLKDNFIKKESINTLLPEQSKNLREENTIIQNSNKVNKTTQITKTSLQHR